MFDCFKKKFQHFRYIHYYIFKNDNFENFFNRHLIYNASSLNFNLLNSEKTMYTEFDLYICIVFKLNQCEIK